MSARIRPSPHRLSRPRTSPFHGGNGGSNPPGDAKFLDTGPGANPSLATIQSIPECARSLASTNRRTSNSFHRKRDTIVRMIRNVILAALGLAGSIAWTVGRPDEVPFRKHEIDLGSSEPCAVADVNGDGKLDIISGENWYEAPRWTKHKFRTINYTGNYIDDFSDLPLDVNGDGHIDVVSCAWFSKRLWWSENPGKGGGLWKEHEIDSGFPIEFAFLVDLDNDGKAREVLPQFGDSKAPLAWYEARNGAFVKHVVSPKSYGHGIGVGDVNGDGRNDILTSQGWLEAPPDPRSGDWKWHGDWDLGALGFIYVMDINGDGRNDIVTSMAHDYGVFWMEQGAGNKWTKHVIDDSWSQAHAMTLADIN